LNRAQGYIFPRMTKSCIWTAIALAFASTAHAQEVKVEIHPAEIENYDVPGRTVGDVSSRLGAGHVAHTRWHVGWKYTFEESSACRLKDFRIDVSATIRMPRWADRDSASPADRRTWDAFDDAMRRHEEGHRENGIHAGQELAREIPGIGARGDCGQLKAAIEQLANRIIAKYGEADEDYDRATHHGVTQGAVLR
jgi:predicted secreted Zn-dependent protease